MAAALCGCWPTIIVSIASGAASASMGPTSPRTPSKTGILSG
jgi:hypothetical protein